jgi:hypothetical protein
MAISDRWAIYVDIEGFSPLTLKGDEGLLGLHDLTEAVFQIGNTYFRDCHNRIFAHQIGDGFVIVSEFGVESLEVPVSMTIAILRHVAGGGHVAKAHLGEGRFSDIVGLAPESVQAARESDGTVRMGSGTMTLFPVMGTALINAVNVGKISPSGPLFTVAETVESRLPKQCIATRVSTGKPILSIDWVHSEISLSSYIQQAAGLKAPNSHQLVILLRKYIGKGELNVDWINSLKDYLGVSQT